MQKDLHLIILKLILFFISTSSFAFIPIRSQNGSIVHYPPNTVIRIRTNTANASQIAANDIFSILTTSLNRWRQAAHNAFSFQYYQGTDLNLFPTQANQAGLDSQIFFTSMSSSQSQINCSVVAATQVYFDQNTGLNQRFDLRFNDVCHKFSTNPNSTGSSYEIYLGDVATHEIGHAIGLDHSQVLQSAMVYTVAKEIAKPSCDDEAAMLAIHAPTSARLNTSEITGRILSPTTHEPVFGAHVVAINLNRGVALTSALTLSDGSFRLMGLEEGTYALEVEPFFPGSSALGPYYSNINPNVCSGLSFKRSFIIDPQNPNTLKTYSVSAGQTLNIDPISVSCSEINSLNQGREQNYLTAPNFDGSMLLQSPIATVSVFNNSNPYHYYRLQNAQGQIEVTALSHSLFSNTDVEVAFLDLQGRVLTNQQIQSDVFYSASSGFINKDSKARIYLNSPQDILIRVRNLSDIPLNLFPSGNLGVSPTKFYMLTISSGINSNTSTLFPQNARCEMNDDFTLPPNLGNPPPIQNFPSSVKLSQDTSTSGFFSCGSINHLSKKESTINLKNFIYNFLELVFLISIILIFKPTKFKSRKKLTA